MKVTVIIPAHNEENRLASTLRRYAQALQAEFGPDFELLVVANGCVDGTARIAEETAADHRQIRVIDIEERIGKGGAVLEGFRQARGERVAFADADGATAPESLIRLLGQLDSSDVAIGSRRLPQSRILQRQPIGRRLFSRAFNLGVRTLYRLPYRDTQCGAKAFRRDAAHKLACLVQQTRWAFDVDLLLCAYALDLSVREVPVIWTDQKGSKVGLRSAGSQVVRSLWQMKLRRLPRPQASSSFKCTPLEQTRPSTRILALNWRCLRHPQAGGSEVNIFQQARHWVQTEYEVTVVTADPGRRHAPERNEMLDGIEIRRMGNHVTVYLLAFLYFLRHRREIDQIVDVANGIPFFTPLLAGRKPGTLLVHHVHGKQWYTEFPWPIAAVGWFLERKVVPFVYRNWPVIAVSPTTRDALIQLGYRESQITVVYNGVEAPQVPEERLPARPRVAYVGRLRRYKRLERLVKMVGQLRDRFPDIHLDLAGDGDARAEIEALVEELGLSEHVTVHGFVDDQQKATILSSATVFATPSMHEGWGLSVIEANSYGCPAVAYDVPGLQVAIRHGVTGLLARDDRGFRSAMALILEDEELRARLSQGARAWAAKFDWHESAMETLEVLQKWNMADQERNAA